MPSKEESKPATRADVKKLDQKIDDTAKRFAMEFIKVNDRIDKVEAAISSNTNRILTALDQYTKTAEANNRAAVIHGQTLSDHAQALQDHGKRLTALEAKA